MKWTMYVVGALWAWCAALTPVCAAPMPAAVLSEVAGAARGAADLGPARETTRVRLAVVLRYRDEAGLRSIVDSAPTPVRRRTIDAATFRELFAPSVASYAGAVDALTARGLRIEALSTNRTVIDVSGSPSTIARAFGTRIDAVRDADGRIAYANMTPAYVPAELRDAVYGIVGFDSRRLLQPAYAFAGKRLAPLGAPAGFDGPLQGPDTGFSPRAFTHAYDFPVVRPRTPRLNGAGQAAAIVIDADYLDSDVATYLSYFKIKRAGPPVQRILINGGPPSGLTRDSVETMLDVQTILGASPEVALSVYETDSLSYSSIVDAYNQINAADAVGAVNSSFGGCETESAPYFPQIADYLALQGAALGIVYSASSGDGGAFNVCGSGFIPDGVETPASGPHFVAVGGTTLFFNPLTANYRFEFGWYASGGGVSSIFALPAYQAKIGNIADIREYTKHGIIYVPKRNVPDIAFDADPVSGEALFIGGQWRGPIGGTSLSSPLFVGLVAQLAQYRGIPLGDLHVPLYSTFLTDRYSAPPAGPLFHDITAGNNGYLAQRGYDQITGIGSLDGWNYAQAGQL